MGKGFLREYKVETCIVVILGLILAIACLVRYMRCCKACTAPTHHDVASTSSASPARLDLKDQYYNTHDFTEWEKILLKLAYPDLEKPKLTFPYTKKDGSKEYMSLSRQGPIILYVPPNFRYKTYGQDNDKNFIKIYLTEGIWVKWTASKILTMQQTHQKKQKQGEFVAPLWAYEFKQKGWHLIKTHETIPPTIKDFIDKQPLKILNCKDVDFYEGNWRNLRSNCDSGKQKTDVIKFLDVDETKDGESWVNLNRGAWGCNIPQNEPVGRFGAYCHNPDDSYGMRTTDGPYVQNKYTPPPPPPPPPPPHPPKKTTPRKTQ